MVITIAINYEDYKNFGYSIIPEEEFDRYFDMAVKTIRKYIKSFKEIAEENKRCICEIIDILYAEHNNLNRQLAGFSNENYREQYFVETVLSAEQKIFETLRLYFTNEELYRGV